MTEPLTAIYRPKIIHQRVGHITRILSGTGSFLVTQNQVVSPTDVIGQYSLPSGFFTIDLAKKLSTSPQDAAKTLAKPLGSRIYQGELLATKTSFLSTTNITSPTDGIISDYDQQTGVLSLKFFPKQVNLVSGVYGIVDGIDPQKGQIFIKTLTTQISGVAGVGKPRLGLLKVITTPSNVLTGPSLKPDMSGYILVCGAKLEPTLFPQAIRLGITGLLAGGIDWHDFTPLINSLEEQAQLITDPGMGLMAFEGFGPIAIPDDVHSILISNQEKYVYLEGHRKILMIPDNTPQSIDVIRKTSIPLPDNTNAPEQLRSIEIGQTVRLIWPSSLGVVGKIIAIDKTPTVLESGLASYLLTIETSSRKIRVPFQNIEQV